MAVKAASAAFSAEATTSAASPWGSTATKPDPVCQRLEHLIRYSLDRFQFRNAVFLAERLRSLTHAPGHSAAEQEYAQYLLAVCHYRQGSFEMAWAALEDCSSPRSQFLFAQCCLELRRYIECNGALERLLELPYLPKCSATDFLTNRGWNGEPDRASILNLLGHAARAQKRHQLAIKYFKEALEINPFLWEGFENLCELGAPQDPEKMFAQFDVKAGNILPKSIALPQRSRTLGVDGSELQGGRATATQDENIESASMDSAYNQVNLPSGVTKRALERSATISSFATSGPLRGLKSRNNMKNNPLVSKKDSLMEDREDQKESAMPLISPAVTEAELEAEEEALRMVADIIRMMARAYGLLALNKFTESLAEFLSLPSEHLLSGWVQCQIAKTRFGMEEYASAAQYFRRARELEPSLHRDMEMYSTCLWHLRDDMALSTLAKELKDSNRLSPQAWCALGNAYSRRHENDQALKCFQRAIQLHDRFAYAHTLSGHEYADLEEYDKAQTEYRAAMSIDPRHYYAWYGMGMIFDKMGKNDLALIHYKEAQKLNPSSGVLLYRVGTIQEKMNRITEALRSFEEALSLDPNNVAARYHKAKVQADLEQFEESLKELEVVKKHRHNEPNVFMLQGKILMKMGNKELALKYLTWALDLDSKSSHAIRDLIEKVDQDANVEEENYEVKVDMDD
ncbi:anaphase-promoting complex subunit cdc27 [Mortierella antarctica]|nr:anaphase-promoting complex subunit cdc27 [Mortierella antarctica]